MEWWVGGGWTKGEEGDGDEIFHEYLISFFNNSKDLIDKIYRL